jgi:hypothetical protein
VSDYCGAVMQPVDPNNLEPEEHHEYQDKPTRTPDILVQCYKPSNGENVNVTTGRRSYVRGKKDTCGKPDVD